MAEENNNTKERDYSLELLPEPETKKEDKKAKGQTYLGLGQWLKIPALIVCVLSAFGMLLGGAGLILLWKGDLQQENFQKQMEDMLLDTYGYILIQETGMLENADVKGLDGLDGGSICYTVTTRAQNRQNETVLYSNDPSTDSENYGRVITTAEQSVNYQYVYNTGSFYDMLTSMWLGTGTMAHIRHELGISGFVYAKDQGLVYCHAGGKYFLMPEFRRTAKGGENENDDLYWLEEKDGKYFYTCENAEEGKKVMDETILWEWVNAGEIYGDFDFAIMDSGDFPEDSVMVYEEDYTDYVIGFDTCTFSYSPVQYAAGNVYSVYLRLGNVKSGRTFHNGIKDYFWQAKKFSAFVSGVLKYHGILLVVSVILFGICFFYLLAKAGRRDEKNRLVLSFWDKIPFELFTVLTGSLLWFAFSMLFEEMDEFAEFAIFSPGIGLAVPVALICIPIGYFVSVAARIKSKKFWHYTLCYCLWWPLRMIGRKIRSNVPLFVKGLLLLTGISFVEYYVLALGDFETVMCYFMIYKVLEYIALIHILYQIDQIDKGGMRVAAGNYNEQIPTAQMFWEFKRIAENINHVSDGIALAVEDKMKSERFKTELITNVSHDIKTPLTSIINYVDLMKKEEITSESMQEYVAVLDRQSMRLKKLIEDLMEASKASTGTLPVHMELCDATVMLTQVAGEFKERAELSQLELVVESPDSPVSIMADGRHLWRVIDNLMSNICKYSMPGTRVYITLEQFHGMVIMTFRNISKSRLNISSEELMERFVRGDSSRNTEGSGLGLSIAQSLTGLMNGNMAIQIDGDLFKAIVSFEEVV